MSAEHDPFAEFEDAAADQGERPDDSAERDEAGDLRWLMSSKRGRRFVARLLSKTGVITPPTDTGNYAVNNADIPAAYASPVFGPDYTVAQLRAAFTSKVGGPLDTTPAKGIGVGTTYVDFTNRTTNFPG